MQKAIKHFLGYLQFVVIRFREDRCFQVAGSLTYTTTLSLVPLITVAVSLFSTFPAFSELLGYLEDFVQDNMLPDAAEKVITVYMGEFSQKAAKLNAMGIAILAVTATMLMLTIDRSFNKIWRVQRPRSLLLRFLTYWAVLSLGPLLIGASLSMTSYLVSISGGIGNGAETLGKHLLKFLPLFLTSIAFMLLYLIIPNRYVSFRDALIGGLIAGITFALMERSFALYIANVPTYTIVYGVFASIPILLIWLYLSWVVVLVGAVITATLPHFKDYHFHMNKLPGSSFYEALVILRALVIAQRTGRSLKVKEIRNQTHMSIDQCEEILEALSRAGWAAKLSTNGWVLTSDAENIKFADVFARFVYAPPLFVKELQDDRLSQMLIDFSKKCEERMQVSLKQVFDERPKGLS